MTDIKKFVALPVEALVEASWNYKEDHDELQAKLEANIGRNGIVQNLIVRDIGKGVFEVVNGNHRLRAIKALGFPEVMCFNCGTISDNQAKRIAVETNEIRFKSDIERLSSVIDSILCEFNKEDFDLTSPITSDMLDSFKNQTEWTPPKPIEETPFLELGNERDPGIEFECPSCKRTMTVYKSMIKKDTINA